MWQEKQPPQGKGVWEQAGVFEGASGSNSHFLKEYVVILNITNLGKGTTLQTPGEICFSAACMSVLFPLLSCESRGKSLTN